MSDPTSLSKELIENSLSRNAKKYRINVYDLISSTNTVLRELAEQGEEENTVLIASEQTNGRGRMGRNFFSPSATGVFAYLPSGVAPVCAPSGTFAETG